MKKRILGTAIAVLLVVSQAISVFAAGSRTAGVQPSGESVNYYLVSEITEESFPYIREGNAALVPSLLDLNDGTMSLSDFIAEYAQDLAGQTAGKGLVTSAFSLQAINGGQITSANKHHVALSISSLTSSMTNIQIMYYNAQTGKFELADIISIDYDNQIIVFELDYLHEEGAPVAILADVDTSAVAESSTGTSPKTSVTSNWGMWLGAALVLACAGSAVFIAGKRRKK